MPLCCPLGGADSVNAHSTGVEAVEALIGHLTLAVTLGPMAVEPAAESPAATTPTRARAAAADSRRAVTSTPYNARPSLAMPRRHGDACRVAQARWLTRAAQQRPAHLAAGGLRQLGREVHDARVLVRGGL